MFENSMYQLRKINVSLTNPKIWANRRPLSDSFLFRTSTKQAEDWQVKAMIRLGSDENKGRSVNDTSETLSL